MKFVKGTTVMTSDKTMALLTDTQCHTEEQSATSDLYDSTDPDKRAAVETLDATSLPSNGTGRSDPTVTDDFGQLRDKLAKLLEIISTEGRSRIGKNQKRTRRHIEHIKALVENLPNLLADSACATEDGSAYVDYDYLIDLLAGLDELIAAENALRSEIGTADSFVIEPLPDGDVLIRFRCDSGYGYWHSAGAQIVSRECFNALAKADPDRKRIVDPEADRRLTSYRSVWPVRLPQSEHGNAV